MKKKFSYKDILYKSKRLTALALIVVFGTGLMVTAGMHDEIPVHDGDVLVDSRAATEQNLPQEGPFARALTSTAASCWRIWIRPSTTAKTRMRRRTPPPKRPASWIPWRRSFLSKA